MRNTLVILGILFAVKAAAQTLGTVDANTSDEALIQAAEKMIQEPGKAAEAAEKTIDRTPAVIPENQIPVKMKAVSETVQAPADTTWRLAASVALIVVVGGGFYFAARRWRRTPDKGGQTARIEMMHQFHVGPRRSIALIRVAGETLLVGITDHNINMLKSVALIDDELEGVLGKKQDFNNFLEDEFSIEDVRSALRT